MTKSLDGKTVAITGTLKAMTRSEAEQALEALGATVAGSLSSKIDVLLAGEKAGSKLDKARQLGVEVRDEAWLIALREGRTAPEPEAAPAPAPIAGPLADWVARLEALAIAMRADPRVRITFYLGEPVGAATLARIESSWRLTASRPRYATSIARRTASASCGSRPTTPSTHA